MYRSYERVCARPSIVSCDGRTCERSYWRVRASGRLNSTIFELPIPTRLITVSGRRLERGSTGSFFSLKISQAAAP